MTPIEEKLKEFAKNNHMKGKGPLCVALVVTRHGKKFGLPLDPEALLTDGGGQVMGLGKSAVQTILKDHGIDHVLAEEGGRTSRGSVLAGNLYEIGKFAYSGRRATVEQLIFEYNTIVEKCETDPSLRIDVAR